MLKNILIIDDDEYTLSLVELIAAKYNFAENVIKLTTVNEAIGYFERLVAGTVQAVPDLIFLDIHMPVSNGWDFLEEYTQRFEKLFSSAVCILSASVDPEDFRRYKAYPRVIAFVDKSYLVDEIKKLKKNEVLRHFFGCPDNLIIENELN